MQRIFSGAISINAALHAGSRDIYKVYLAQGKRDLELSRIERAAQARSIPIEKIDSQSLDQLAQSKNHGGIAAMVSERRYQTLGELSTQHVPFIVLMDGVEDPHNLGQALRALYAAGASGVMLAAREWGDAEGVVARASAGASEWLPIALMTHPADAIQHMRSKHIKIAITSHEKDARSIYEADLKQPLFVIVGGERRGIGREFEEAAELKLRIPYAREVSYSLGAATATSIIAFEIMRQRKSESNVKVL